MRQGNWVNTAVIAFGLASFGAGIFVALNLPGESADVQEGVVVVAAPAPVKEVQDKPADLIAQPIPAATVDLIQKPVPVQAPPPVAWQPAPYYGDDDLWDDDAWDDDLWDDDAWDDDLWDDDEWDDD